MLRIHASRVLLQIARLVGAAIRMIVGGLCSVSPFAVVRSAAWHALWDVEARAWKRAGEYICSRARMKQNAVVGVSQG